MEVVVHKTFATPWNLTVSRVDVASWRTRFQLNRRCGVVMHVTQPLLVTMAHDLDLS
jgi:hypothetical protein